MANWRLAILVFAGCCAASTAPAQTVVGPDSKPGRYNRLHDMAARPTPTIAPAKPDVFGTAAIGAGVTFYDARFRRVSVADRDHPEIRALAEPLRGLPPEQQLAAAQSAVAKRVRWTHDLDNMRVADFWSNAAETLQRGTGDSEDIAIVVMQVLKAAGFSPRDLYLSIGRHRQAGTHVVLLARTPSGFMMIDDRAGRPLPATAEALFSPVMTVGLGKSWLHGRRLSGASAHASAR
ncbi:transglutaminase-like cysteine peptidase [Sphingomonas mesophila]|uniref:transglutaminase-like cysteine peptidase n=1 Tax=Sphingomonas mesophila TaxID=2303576 RepID=UPI000E58C6F8|nr:transglutaminase-like cysteine peptidase [Sphingomonas mesophila]